MRLLVNELAHRVKNTLAVVQSITEQTFRWGSDVNGIRQALGGRLQALADTHTLLTLSNWQSVDFGSLSSRSTGHLVRDDSRPLPYGRPRAGPRAQGQRGVGPGSA